VKTVCCFYQLLPRLGYEHWQKNLLTQQLPMKTIHPKQLLELAFRLYVFVFLNVYGLGKLLGGQFYTPESIPEEVASIPLGVASNFDLAWTFMGRSYGYILFIGISQLLGAWMLLFPRTKLLGVVILLPILANIIVFDIFFLDAFGALASAVIYFSMLMGVLVLNWEKVVGVFRILTTRTQSRGGIWNVVLAILLCAVIFLLDQQLGSLVGAWKGVGTKDSLPVGK
jgi:hypothetical protein